MRAVILEVLEWLASDECHDNDDAHLIAGLGRRLRSAGLPVDRLALHLRTLHPEILGRTVAWSPNEPVQVMDRENGLDLSTDFVGSPVRHVMQTLEHLSIRTDKPSSQRWTYLDVYKGRELVELMIVPLANVDGPVSAAAFCTKRPDGFTRNERESIERIVPALRNVCELRTLRKFDLTLLDTYTGKATAQRILAGQIRRGQVESLEAALLICDLRGFTEIANRLPGGKVLELLDSYFDRVVPAITEGGGEIVKFMGDAVLAFFQRDVAADSCRAAMQAAQTALGNLGRPPASHGPMNAGIALHYGEMSYGSIGSGRRLDFTVIGPDVNLISRIQTVCAATGEPLLVSQRFAELLRADDLVSVGHYSVKGFQEPVHLYAQTRPQGQA
ncbi:adenylate/guanylate cyclase domain-containing protein [Bradyrhizobium erythrophlei]|uniref:adenylate/guanylate cyclase domain-containing protein n=1 Tax=Bradyrhizobium erythrophlei TaxID=1437360 RepID=UPI0035E9420F